jgi:hypothetical protein
MVGLQCRVTPDGSISSAGSINVAPEQNNHSQPSKPQRSSTMIHLGSQLLLASLANLAYGQQQGYGQTCKTVYETVYETIYEEKCEYEYKEHCEYKDETTYEEHCTTEYVDHCTKVHYKTTCKKVPKRICEKKPVQKQVKKCEKVPEKVCKKHPVQISKKVAKQECHQATSPPHSYGPTTDSYGPAWRATSYSYGPTTHSYGRRG